MRWLSLGKVSVACHEDMRNNLILPGEAAILSAMLRLVGAALRNS
jgi:hypothetical protein